MRVLHIPHFEKNKTVALARSLYYWKQMTKDIEQLIDKCERCQVNSNLQQKETLKQTFAEHPMPMNSLDLAEYNKKMYLIHADRY